jgi:hypothetical protein
MSTSKFALRSKTLEANDLENAVAVSSASRFIPQAYTVRRSDGNYSATPNTGRISIQAERANFEQIVSWSSGVIDALRAEQGEASAFIKNFARPVSLVDIPPAVYPTYLAFDIGSLRETLYGETPTALLVRKQGDNYVEVAEVASRVILNDLDQHFAIGRDGDQYATLCAFMNGRGGQVLVGVRPDGSVVGQTIADKTLQDLAQVLRRFDPPIPVETERIPAGTRRRTPWRRRSMP